MRHRDDEVHNVNANVVGQDFLEMFELRIDWANPANSSMVGPTASPCGIRLRSERIDLLQLLSADGIEYPLGSSPGGHHESTAVSTLRDS